MPRSISPYILNSSLVTIYHHVSQLVQWLPSLYSAAWLSTNRMTRGSQFGNVLLLQMHLHEIAAQLLTAQRDSIGQVSPTLLCISQCPNLDICLARTQWIATRGPATRKTLLVSYLGKQVLRDGSWGATD